MKNNLMSVAIGLVCLFSTTSAFASVPDTIPGTTKIMAEDVISLVGKYDDLIIIDARIVQDRKAGYIEGSVSLPDVKTTEITMANVIPSKTTPVIFYCNGVKCGRSVKSAKYAVKWGYKHIYWFRGGWEEWSAKGMPSMKD